MSELSTFDDDGHLDHMGFVPGGWGEWMMGTYRNGHDWYGDAMPDNIAIDHPLSREAMEHVVDIYARGGGWDSVGGALEGWGNQQLGNPMIAGVASSIRSGIFTVNVINSTAPGLTIQARQVPPWPQWRASGSDPGLLEHGHTHKCREPGRGLDISQIPVAWGRTSQVYGGNSGPTGHDPGITT